jgi:SAM-dependent methyltransferase
VVEPGAVERRLAQIYDRQWAERDDLDAYLAMAGEFGAQAVLDIGCGTGTFALLLADAGLTVTGVDPSAASLEVALGKPGADRVRWVHGVTADVPPLRADLATMTANVAQEIVTDEAWDATLRAAFDRLRPGGYLVFETRDPAGPVGSGLAGPGTVPSPALKPTWPGFRLHITDFRRANYPKPGQNLSRIRDKSSQSVISGSLTQPQAGA